MTDRTITCTFSVHIACWLRPYLRTLAFICAMTGMEPNMARVKRVIDKGVTVAQVSAESKWRAVVRMGIRLAIVSVLAVASGVAATIYPSHAWHLGWGAGLAYGWVVHPWVAASFNRAFGHKASQ